MTNIAIRVDHPGPEPGRRMSKLYHIGAQQRPDTTSTALSAGLRDAVAGLTLKVQVQFGAETFNLPTFNRTVGPA